VVSKPGLAPDGDRVFLQIPQPLVLCQHKEQGFLVIPAQAGIQIATLDSRLCGSDGTPKSRFDKALLSEPRRLCGKLCSGTKTEEEFPQGRGDAEI
jgi:hypothetical protein